MRLVCDVGPHVPVIPLLRFKRSIIEGLELGKITLHRCVLESIQKSEASHVLNNSQKRLGRVAV